MRPHLLLLLGLIACPKPASPPEPEAPESDARPEPPEHAPAYMQGHAQMASQAREAVIAGERDSWQRVGAQIAGYADASFGLPEPWQPRLDELVFHGNKLGEAETRAAAARSVAEMARTCGACHTENGPGPAFDFDPPPMEESTVSERMARHHWAAQRMWEGLVTPSPALYATGARSLTGAPMWGAEPLPEDVAGLEDRVRALGEEALGAEADSERVSVYAALLAACADCHAAAR